MPVYTSLHRTSSAASKPLRSRNQHFAGCNNNRRINVPHVTEVEIQLRPAIRQHRHELQLRAIQPRTGSFRPAVLPTVTRSQRQTEVVHHTKQIHVRQISHRRMTNNPFILIRHLTFCMSSPIVIRPTAAKNQTVQTVLTVELLLTTMHNHLLEPCHNIRSLRIRKPALRKQILLMVLQPSSIMLRLHNLEGPQVVGAPPVHRRKLQTRYTQNAFVHTSQLAAQTKHLRIFTTGPSHRKLAW